MPNNAQKPANTGALTLRVSVPRASFAQRTRSKNPCAKRNSLDAQSPHRRCLIPITQFPLTLYRCMRAAAQVLPHHQLPQAKFQVRNDFYSCIPVRSAAPDASRTKACAAARRRRPGHRPSWRSRSAAGSRRGPGGRRPSRPRRPLRSWPADGAPFPRRFAGKMAALAST